MDASYNGNEEDWRSTMRCVVTIMEAAVHWVSQVQKNSTLSSKEAEYVAMCRATQEVVFFRNPLSTLQVGVASAHECEGR